jgi:hypothetical protein
MKSITELDDLTTIKSHCTFISCDDTNTVTREEIFVRDFANHHVQVVIIVGYYFELKTG